MAQHTHTVEEILKEGYVPPRHGVYIERREKIKEIREKIYKIQDKDGYVKLLSNLQ